MNTHQDKVVLVTGGGSGIGAAAALRFSVEGAKIAVADINLVAAERVATLIHAQGGTAIAISADISREDDNERMFQLVVEAYGGIDLAFLNAGALQAYLPLEELSVAEFDRMVSINLRGTFLGVRLAHRHLRHGGSCVVTASSAGVIGFADGLAYAAAKHGVVGIVRSAARDFAARGLRINAICPGMVLTPMIGAPQVDEVVAPAAIPLPDYRGGMGPQAIAEVALVLMSPAAARVNGQAQLVDAALLAAFPPI